MNPKFVIAALLILGGWWWMRAPGAQSIMKAVKTEDSALVYRSTRYEVEWDAEEKTYSGDVHELAEDYNSAVPFNTHDLILTTEDYSNPERVKINPLRHGHTTWLYKVPAAQGDLKVLHLVPKDLAICKKIQMLEHGQVASIIGQEETDNRVESSDARSYSFGSKSYGHILFLVTDVQIDSESL